MFSIKEKVSIQELDQVLKAQNALKKDLVIPVNSIRFNPSNGQMIVKNGIVGEELPEGISGNLSSDLSLITNKTALQQLCDKFGISRTYMKRCIESNPSLLYDNLNAWIEQESRGYKFNGNFSSQIKTGVPFDSELIPQKKRNFLLRTLQGEDGNGTARAFLSNSFKIIDNYDIFQAVLSSVMQQSKETNTKIIIDTCDLTEDRMYIRFICPEVEQLSDMLKFYRDPNSGNQSKKIMSGFVVSNSEVGKGAFSISPRLVIGACNNGRIFTNERLYSKHLGGRMAVGNVDWSQQTKNANMDLIINQIKDCVNTFISPDYIGKVVGQMEMDGSYELQNPIETCTNVCGKMNLGESETNKVLNYFAKQGSASTAFDIDQAVTFFAQHDCSADDRFDLESKVTEMLPKIQKIDQMVSISNN